MNTKRILGTLTLLALVAGPTTLLASEPKTHDHLKSKGAYVPKQGSDKTDADCIPAESQDNIQTTADDSKKPAEKCAPKSDSDPLHDHPKMKGTS